MPLLIVVAGIALDASHQAVIPGYLRIAHTMIPLYVRQVTEVPHHILISLPLWSVLHYLLRHLVADAEGMATHEILGLDL